MLFCCQQSNNFLPNLLLQLVNTAVENWQVGAEDIATNCDLNSLVDLRYPVIKNVYGRQAI